MKRTAKNIILLLAVIALLTAPLIFVKNGAFEGADGQAEGVISEVNPDYQPWFSSLMEPASGEIESLLFALQAAIGAGIIGYFFGFVRGKRELENKDNSKARKA